MTMEHYPIEISTGDISTRFEVRDYALDEETDRCTFCVFRNGILIASFRPDKRGILHVCANPGKLDDELLHGIAEKIERVNF